MVEQTDQKVISSYYTFLFYKIVWVLSLPILGQYKYINYSKQRADIFNGRLDQVCISIIPNIHINSAL